MSDIMTQHAIQVAIAQTQHLGVYCWNKSHQLLQDAVIRLVGHLAYYIVSYNKNHHWIHGIVYSPTVTLA